MKRISTLMAMLLVGSSMTFAQDKNLVVNGDFEDTNFESFTFEGKPMNNVIFGWELREGRTMETLVVDDFNNAGFDRWGAYAFYGSNEDPGTEAEENWQFLRFQRYAWAAYTGSHCIKQQIAIEAGKTYKLSFKYRMSELVNDWGRATAGWIEIKVGETEAERIYMENRLDASTWFDYSKEITALDDTETILISLGVDSPKPEPWDENVEEKAKWIDFDNVSLVATDDVGLNEAATSDVQIDVQEKQAVVGGLEVGAVVNVYSTTGMLMQSVVAQSNKVTVDLLQGLYLIQVNNTNGVKVSIR